MGSSNAPSLLMADGMSVILDVNGEKLSFAVLGASQRIKVGKAFCSMAPLINAPYGSTFELHTDSKGKPILVRVTSPPNQEETLQEEAGVGASERAEGKDEAPGGTGTANTTNITTNANTTNATNTTNETNTTDTTNTTSIDSNTAPDAATNGVSGVKDNRGLVDNNTSQALSAGDITNLKRKGVSGRDIVEALVSNSDTFQSKTSFSQEKYKKKKQKKHAPQLTARSPTPQLVCEAYFSKSPARIGYMRSDALAMIMAVSDIQAHSQALILDECGGLLLASAAFRMQGMGSICSVTLDRFSPSVDIVKLVNLSPKSGSIIQSATLDSLLVAADTGPYLQNGVTMGGTPTDGVPMEVEMTEASSAGGDDSKQAVHNSGSADGAVPLEGEKGTEAKDPEKSMDNRDTEEQVGGLGDRGAQERMGEGVTSGAGSDVAEQAVSLSGAAPDSVGVGNDSAILLNGVKEQLCKGGDKVVQEGVQSEAISSEVLELREEVGAGKKEKGEEKKEEGGDGNKGKEDVKGEERGEWTEEGKAAGKKRRREERGGGGFSATVRAASPEQLNTWRTRGFTSLIVAAPSRDLNDLIPKLMTLLQPSSPFAVYHNVLQPLGEVMQELKGSALAMQLCEPWMREYQVLPQRTHPHMQMSATGGYFLHGYVVNHGTHQH